PLETWAYGGANWTLLTPNGPSARLSTSLAYDPSIQSLVLFGGKGPNATYLSDTWTFSGGAWTNVTATAGPGPSPRASMAIAWDAADGYLVGYGGVEPNASLVGNASGSTTTWVFDGATWSGFLNPTNSSPPNLGALAYDSSDSRLIYFGGLSSYHNATAWSASNATWSFAAGIWTNLTGTTKGDPGPALSPGLVDNGRDGSVFLFGGSGGANGSAARNETYRYAQGQWTAVPTGSGRPASRFAPSLAFNASSQEIVLFGGLDLAGLKGDTWNYSAGGWSFVGPKLWVSGAVGIMGDGTASDVGVLVGFYTLGVLGGAETNFTYTGLPSGCPPQGGRVIYCQPDSPGMFDVRVGVVAPSGEFQGPNLSFTVNTDPTVLPPTYSPSLTEPGVPVTIDTAASGGTGGLAYDYGLLPPGCAGSDAPVITCTPSSVGAFRVAVQVHDVLGVVAAASSVLTVGPHPSVSLLSVSPGRIDLGMNAKVSVVAAGGLGALTYAYAGLPDGCPPSNSTVLVCTPTATGQFGIVATATDVYGFAANRSTVLLVNPELVLGSFSVSTDRVIVRSTVSFNVTLSGGTAPYTVGFSNLPIGCTSDNTTSLLCLPQATGLYAVTVTVSDAVGARVTSTVTVDILPPGQQTRNATNGSGGPAGALWGPLGTTAFLQGFAIGIVALVAVLLGLGSYGMRTRRLAREGREIVDELRREPPVPEEPSSPDGGPPG
ncbi:MAG TPA: kelch repeat-containing protein, partial [Thermoplasmata archaeon]|nr:kelch repeat-containing protein [Thermoplasmata archaeon]